MSTIFEYLYVLAPMLIIGVGFWGVSVIKKDVSIVDSVWSLFFIVAVFVMAIQQQQLSDRALVIIFLVIAWGARLSLHITARHWGQNEDHRYQTIRNNNQPMFELKSLYLIFGFQAIIAWIIALPLFFGIQSTAALNYIDAIALLLWMTGMFFEVTADYQLYRFKKNPDNHGKILTEGLWRYTRHPNYFGECLVWWALFIFVIAGYSGINELREINALISLISPMLMTFLLLKFSGVQLLEKTMKTRSGYEAYMHNTNAFIPGFVRKKQEGGDVL